MYEIDGPDSIINNYVAGYCVVPQDAATYNWVLTGGNIVCGQGTAAVIVQWTVIGEDSIEVDLTNAQGMLINSITLPVDVSSGGNTPHS